MCCRRAWCYGNRAACPCELRWRGNRQTPALLPSSSTGRAIVISSIMKSLLLFLCQCRVVSLQIISLRGKIFKGACIQMMSAKIVNCFENMSFTQGWTPRYLLLHLRFTHGSITLLWKLSMKYKGLNVYAKDLKTTAMLCPVFTKGSHKSAVLRSGFRHHSRCVQADSNAFILNFSGH